MRVRILIENKETPFFKFEHGLSLLIEYNGKKILFDTGKSNSFLDNAKKLNLDLSSIDYVVLSHAHYDHTTGLEEFINTNNYNKNIYVGSSFNNDKYETLDEGGVKYIGIPFDINSIKNINYVNDSLTICEGLTLYNNFKLENNFESINPKLISFKNNKYIPDTFNEETVLTIDTEKGLIIVVGCSHVGICNIIKQVKERSNKKIRGVIGGFHLFRASLDYTMKVIEDLKKLDLEFVMPMHCTCRDLEFKNAFKSKCIIKETGDLFIIDEEANKSYKPVKSKLGDSYGEQTDRNYRDGDRN